MVSRPFHDDLLFRGPASCRPNSISTAMTDEKIHFFECSYPMSMDHGIPRSCRGGESRPITVLSRAV